MLFHIYFTLINIQYISELFLPNLKRTTEISINLFTNIFECFILNLCYMHHEPFFHMSQLFSLYCLESFITLWKFQRSGLENTNSLVRMNFSEKLYGFVLYLFISITLCYDGYSAQIFLLPNRFIDLAVKLAT